MTKVEKALILIVDDDESNIMLLKELLHEEGYRVIPVLTGKEALEEVKKNEFDLIILDLMLPDIDGFQICKKLKTKRETNIIPILMLTGLNEIKDKISGLQVGANSYIVKPFDTENLLKEIEKLLQWRKHIESKKDYEIGNFTLKSEIHYLDELNNIIANILQRNNLSEEEIEEIKAGIYEIGVNAIEWGNKFNKHLLVKVRYEISKDYFRITIEDEGKGFNFLEYLDNKYKGIEMQDQREEEGKRLGGFGIMLTRNCFDSITYNDTGNIATLEKRFN